MTSTTHLTLPPVAPARYAKNFLRQVVCEFRFPTLFELEATRPPPSFAKALRRDYPVYQANDDLSVSMNGVDKAHVHTFTSLKPGWTVTLRAASITIETTKYDCFEDFKTRLTLLIKSAADVIDSEYFTRIGLRYINVIPCGSDRISEWLNPQLVGVNSSDIFGGAVEFSGRIAGPAKVGGYLLNHGLGGEPSSRRNEYVVDMDFFANDIAVDEALATVDTLHMQEFELFSWTLGTKAHEYLESSSRTKQR
jgi:uncharacterized protein (TIGR04255 family)